MLHMLYTLPVMSSYPRVYCLKCWGLRFRVYVSSGGKQVTRILYICKWCSGVYASRVRLNWHQSSRGKGLAFQVKIEVEEPRRNFGEYSWFRVMVWVFFRIQHCDGRHRNNVNSDLAFYCQLESCPHRLYGLIFMFRLWGLEFMRRGLAALWNSSNCCGVLFNKN